MKEVKNAEFKTRRNYDWNKLMDGRAWKVTRGVDFDCSCQTFRTYCYIRAQKCDKKVKTSVDKNTVTVQFFEKESDFC